MCAVFLKTVPMSGTAAWAQSRAKPPGYELIEADKKKRPRVGRFKGLHSNCYLRESADTPSSSCRADLIRSISPFRSMNACPHRESEETIQVFRGSGREADLIGSACAARRDGR